MASISPSSSSLSQLHKEWNVQFKPESVESLLPSLISAHLFHTEADLSSSSSSSSPQKPDSLLSISNLKKFLLSTDPRSLPLVPPLPENAFRQKGGEGADRLSCPLFVMLISARDITLPSRESEERFTEEGEEEEEREEEEDGENRVDSRQKDAKQSLSRYIYSGKRRLLLLKVTAGPGCTYTAIEHRYCKQFNNVPLIPGLKFLLSPNTRLLNQLLLLTPQDISVLGGEVRNLSSACRLKEKVSQHRLQHSLHLDDQGGEEEEGEKNGKGGGGGGGGEERRRREEEGQSDLPPKFIPFSYKAAQKAKEEGEQVVRATLMQQKQKDSLANAPGASSASSSSSASPDLQKLRE
ncbi:hypothetical protein CSUI_006704, partial [Cystoisospora suis]